MLKKPIEYWKRVIWSNESKANIFDSDGKAAVWRTPREEFDSNYIVPIVKHDGGLVLIWVCFKQRAVGKLWILDGIMDKFYYCDILEKTFVVIDWAILIETAMLVYAW